MTPVDIVTQVSVGEVHPHQPCPGKIHILWGRATEVDAVEVGAGKPGIFERGGDGAGTVGGGATVGGGQTARVGGKAAVEVGIAQGGAGEISLSQIDVFEVGARQRGGGVAGGGVELGPAEIRAGEIGEIEVRALQQGIDQAGLLKTGRGQRGVEQLRTHPISGYTIKRGAIHEDVGQIHLGKDRTGELQWTGGR